MLDRTRVACAVLGALGVCAQAIAQPSLFIRDYVATPMTGLPDGKGNNEQLLSRINTLREETGGAGDCLCDRSERSLSSSTRGPNRSRPISTSTAATVMPVSFRNSSSRPDSALA